MVGPSIRGFLSNFATFDAPLATKVRLTIVSNWTKIRSRSECCGNLGQPGC